MPYPTEHAARIHSPEGYDRMRRKNDEFGEGVHCIYGVKDGKAEVQAIRFDKDKFTPEEAKKWLKDHKYKVMSFEEASGDEKSAGDEWLVAVTVAGEMLGIEDIVERYAKAISLDEQSRKVRDAFRVHVNEKPKPPMAMEEVWAREVFPDHVIAEAPDGLWSYPYTANAQGEIEFGQPVKVEIEYKPISAEKSLAIKTLRKENGGVVVGGYLLLWGDPQKKDLQGDYFTKSTWLGLTEYPSVPAMFHHGLDDAVGVSVIGKRVKAQTDDAGVWVEDWLNTASAYWKLVKPLLDAEALYYSPGSAPHLVKRAEDGELKTFPVVEDTLTPIPAQHRLRPVEQIKAAYKSAGLEFPETAGDAGASRAEAEVERVLAEIDIDLMRINLEVTS